MKRVEKDKWMEEIRNALQGVKLILLADYRGMKVGDMTNLRRDIKRCGGNMKVIKNTLFLRVINGTGLEMISSLVSGPTAMVYTRGDPVAVLKVISGWAKSQPSFLVRGGGLVSGAGKISKILQLSDIQELAKLPDRSVLLGNVTAQLIYPLRRLTQVLGSALFEMVWVLKAIKAQRESKEGG